MAWVRLDDQFTEHPKVVDAGPAAAWLYVRGLTYCARQLTDGVIPASQVRRFGAGASRLAERLVAVGLWERQAAGFRVHDYLDYNPSRLQVLALRQQRAAAGQRGGKQRASKLLEPRLPSASDDVEAKPYPVPQPQPVPHASAHADGAGEEETVGAGHAFAPGGAGARSTGRKRRSATGAHHALFRVLTERFGAPANQAEGGKIGKAAQLLLEAGVTPEEVGPLADACAARWGPGACTPMALAGNVTALRRPAPTAGTGQERYFPDHRSATEKAANPRREWRETYEPPGAQEQRA